MQLQPLFILLSYLFAAYFFISSAVLICIAALICSITCLVDPRRRILHYFASWWGYHYTQINPFWKCTFINKDYIDPSKTYVLIANHQSFFDIFVLYGLYKPFKWVSKESIFKVPFVGWNMMLNQYVLIKRGDLKSIKEMMDVCRNWLNKGASVMMFPEGTRSEDGEIKKFRDGAFKLAIDCNVELVPIVITGTHEILSKRSRYLCFKKHIFIKVLPPVSGAQFEHNASKMRNYVQKLMSDTLAEMRNEGRTRDIK